MSVAGVTQLETKLMCFTLGNATNANVSIGKKTGIVATVVTLFQKKKTKNMVKYMKLSLLSGSIKGIVPLIDLAKGGTPHLGKLQDGYAKERLAETIFAATGTLIRIATV